MLLSDPILYIVVVPLYRHHYQKRGGNYPLRTRYKKSLSRREAMNRNTAFEKEVEVKRDVEGEIER